MLSSSFQYAWSSYKAATLLLQLCSSDMYSFYEPNVFEAMACLHSRLRRLVYSVPKTQSTSISTGHTTQRKECGSRNIWGNGISKHDIHHLPGTNHNYRAFEYRQSRYIPWYTTELLFSYPSPFFRHNNAMIIVYFENIYKNYKFLAHDEAFAMIRDKTILYDKQHIVNLIFMIDLSPLLTSICHRRNIYTNSWCSESIERS